MLLVPGSAIGVVAGLLDAAVAPASPDALPTSHAGLFARGAIGVVAAVATFGVTTGLVDGAARNGRVRLRDGGRAFRRRSPALAMVVVGGLGTGAAALAPYMASLSLFGWAFASVYALAAAFADDRGGRAALRASTAFALARPGATSLLVVTFAGVPVVAAAVVAALGTGLTEAVAAGVVTQVPLALLAVIAAAGYGVAPAFDPMADGLGGPKPEETPHEQ